MRNNNGKQFTVNKAYKKEDMVQTGEQPKFWIKIWKCPAPTKVKCFTWLVAKRACLTREVLKRKGSIIVSKCYLCNERDETNNHLFLHCKFTAQLWSLFFYLTKTNWLCQYAWAYCRSTKLLDEKRRQQDPEKVVEDAPSL